MPILSLLLSTQACSAQLTQPIADHKPEKLARFGNWMADTAPANFVDQSVVRPPLSYSLLNFFFFFFFHSKISIFFFQYYQFHGVLGSRRCGSWPYEHGWPDHQARRWSSPGLRCNSCDEGRDFEVLNAKQVLGRDNPEKGQYDSTFRKVSIFSCT